MINCMYIFIPYAHTHIYILKFMLYTHVFICKSLMWVVVNARSMYICVMYVLCYLQVREVEDEVFDLFVALDATDDQLDFPFIYASARQGMYVCMY